MISVEMLGYIGAILFAFCGLPQAIKSYREGHAEGLSHLFIWMWFWGEVLTICYVLLKHGLDIPLIGNYTFNLLLLAIIIRYKYFPKTADLETLKTRDIDQQETYI